MSQKDYQGELFSHTEEGMVYKPQAARKPFYLRIRSYEKALLLIMGAALLSIVSYSLGVEKGKHAAEFSEKDTSFYTIQVAAFSKRQLALREAQVLTKNGFAPVAYVRGNYIILCVGKFSDQESAQPVLSQLQKTYVNCRIRRL